jgi:hypothetical protein
MTTYATLRTRISSELDRTDLNTAGYVASEVLSAIKHYERQRFWFNEGRETASTVASQVNLAVDTELLEIDDLRITISSRPYQLRRVSWEEFLDMGGTDTSITGQPTHYAYYANQLWFYPIPNSTYTLTMSCHEQLAALSADADTNAWTVAGEELIRARAKAALKINYLEEAEAKAEARGFAMRGEPYLSMQEKIAHLSLMDTANDRVATGRVRATQF